jgi:hypothetical protein
MALITFEYGKTNRFFKFQDVQLWKSEEFVMYFISKRPLSGHINKFFTPPFPYLNEAGFLLG